MIRKSLAALVMLALTSTCFSFSVPADAKETASAVQTGEQKAYDKAHGRLIPFLTKHMTRCNLALRPNREHPDISRQKDGRYVASYIAMDPDSVSVDMQPTESRYFQYIARVKYRENHFQCVAETQKDALKGPFHLVKVRRLTEIARYSKGKWSM